MAGESAATLVREYVVRSAELLARAFLVRPETSEIELQGELNQSRIVACRNDAAEIALIDNSARVGIYA